MIVSFMISSVNIISRVYTFLMGSDPVTIEAKVGHNRGDNCII